MEANGANAIPENIQVYLRMRPLNQREIQEDQAVSAWRIVDRHSVTLDQAIFNRGENGMNARGFIIPAGAYASLLAPCPGGPNQSKAYSFNGCFDPQESNQEVYEKSSLRAIVMSSLEGINGTVFMYGQTGAGKTFTMLGNAGMRLKEQTVGEQLSPRSAKIQRRSASSARCHYNPMTQSQSQLQSSTSVTRQSLQSQNSSITPRQQRPSIVPPLPPMTKVPQNLKGSSITSRNGSTTEGGFSQSFVLQQQPEQIIEAQQEVNSLHHQEGILITSIKELFQKIRQDNNNNTSSSSSFDTFTIGQRVYIVRCSYFEIYNDAVYDLLNSHKEAAFNEPLQLQEDIRKKEFVVKGLKEYVVESYDDCLKLLRLGEYHRHYAETRMNHQSSRSHTLFRLHVESVATSTEGDDAGTNVIRESVLNFVDLAGSEKVSNHHSNSGGSVSTDNNGVFVSPKGSLTRKGNMAQEYNSIGSGSGMSGVSMRVKEGQHINKSLFFLTQVIALKAEMMNKKQPASSSQFQANSDAHIPYRNSPLTKILRSSLGGSSRTAIVLCITPSATQLEQTFSTLRFGQNAKMIRNTVVANVKGMGANEQEMRNILGEYERRLREMESDKNDSSRKLRQIIENLMKEKDELNQRLIKANNVKLLAIGVNTELNQSASKNDITENSNSQSEEDSNPQYQMYMWNTGMLHSSQPIDKLLLPPSQQQKLQSRDIVIHQTSQALETSQQTLLLEALRTSKHENTQLLSQINDLDAQLNEAFDRIDSLQTDLNDCKQLNEALTLDKSHLEQANDSLEQSNIELLDANRVLQDTLDQRNQLLSYTECQVQEKDLVIAQQLSVIKTQEQVNSQQKQRVNDLERVIAQYKQQEVQMREEISRGQRDSEKLQRQLSNKNQEYLNLQKTRYHLTDEAASQMDKEQIYQIEQSLFLGIQFLNIEKGKRLACGINILTPQINTTQHRKSASSASLACSSQQLNPLESAGFPQTTLGGPVQIKQSPIQYQNQASGNLHSKIAAHHTLDQPSPQYLTQRDQKAKVQVLLMSGENMKVSSLESSPKCSVGIFPQTSSRPYIGEEKFQINNNLVSGSAAALLKQQELEQCDESATMLFFSSPEDAAYDQIIMSPALETKDNQAMTGILPRQNLLGSFNAEQIFENNEAPSFKGQHQKLSDPIISSSSQWQEQQLDHQFQQQSNKAFEQLKIQDNNNINNKSTQNKNQLQSNNNAKIRKSQQTFQNENLSPSSSQQARHSAKQNVKQTTNNVNKQQTEILGQVQSTTRSLNKFLCQTTSAQQKQDIKQCQVIEERRGSSNVLQEMYQIFNKQGVPQINKNSTNQKKVTDNEFTCTQQNNKQNQLEQESLQARQGGSKQNIPPNQQLLVKSQSPPQTSSLDLQQVMNFNNPRQKITDLENESRPRIIQQQNPDLIASGINRQEYNETDVNAAKLKYSNQGNHRTYNQILSLNNRNSSIDQLLPQSARGNQNLNPLCSLIQELEEGGQESDKINTPNAGIKYNSLAGVASAAAQKFAHSQTSKAAIKHSQKTTTPNRTPTRFNYLGQVCDQNEKVDVSLRGSLSPIIPGGGSLNSAARNHQRQDNMLNQDCSEISASYLQSLPYPPTSPIGLAFRSDGGSSRFISDYKQHIDNSSHIIIRKTPSANSRYAQYNMDEPEANQVEKQKQFQINTAPALNGTSIVNKSKYLSNKVVENKGGTIVAFQGQGISPNALKKQQINWGLAVQQVAPPNLLQPPIQSSVQVSTTSINVEEGTKKKLDKLQDLLLKHPIMKKDHQLQQ